MTKEPIVLGNRFISLLSDYGFRKIMGAERNTELLIDLINTSLQGIRVVKRIEICDSAVLGRTKFSRNMALDIRCYDETGAEFIVELQHNRHRFFSDRAQYYAAESLAQQARKGNWDFSLVPVYVICLLDFKLDDTDPDEFYHPIGLANLRTHQPFSDKLNFVFIELPKFHGMPKIPENRLEMWCYLISNIDSLEEIPVEFKNDPIFQRVFEDAEIINLNKDDMRQFSARQRAQWEDYSIKQTWRWEAREEARKEAEEREKILINSLLESGVTTETISIRTGMAIEEIQRILKS